VVQRNLVASLFSLANHSWMEIIERAKANVEELKVLTEPDPSAPGHSWLHHTRQLPCSTAVQRGA
jgi:hypothetical protein